MNFLHESGDPRYITFNDYSTSVAALKNAPKRRLTPVELEKARLHWYIQDALNEPYPLLTLKAHRDVFASKHQKPDLTFSEADTEILEWLDLWIQEFEAVEMFNRRYEAEPEFIKEA